MAEAEKKTRILISDRHPVFRDSLNILLETEPSFRIVGKAGDKKETLHQVERLKPDILLLDFSLVKTDGAKVAKELSLLGSRVHTIVLSDDIETHQIPLVFEQGARGLIMKDADTRMLVEGIRSVQAGNYWVGEKSMKTPYRGDKALKKPPAPRGNSRKYNLTPREMEVIKAIVTGMKTKEIARKLSISEQTVKHHITNIFDKVGVYNRLELTLFAFHHKLTEI